MFILSRIKTPIETVEKINNAALVEVENTECWRVVYNNKSEIMYTVSDGRKVSGDFTLLVDEDGKPLLYNKLYNSSNKSPMFTKIGETNLSDGCMLVYHKDTKIIYSVSDFKLNSGNFTLMTDENQKPLLYEE